MSKANIICSLNRGRIYISLIFNKLANMDTKIIRATYNLERGEGREDSQCQKLLILKCCDYLMMLATTNWLKEWWFINLTESKSHTINAETQQNLQLFSWLESNLCGILLFFWFISLFCFFLFKEIMKQFRMILSPDQLGKFTLP